MKEVPNSSKWVWVAEIQTNIDESVVGGYEPASDSFCTWLKVNNNFMFGHYGLKSKKEMLKDLIERV